MGRRVPEPETGIDIMDRALAVRLGLGSLLNRRVCHGYANGCPCHQCAARQRNVSKRFRQWLDGNDEPMPRMTKRRGKTIKQPWDLAA